MGEVSWVLNLAKMAWNGSVGRFLVGWETGVWAFRACLSKKIGMDFRPPGLVGGVGVGADKVPGQPGGGLTDRASPPDEVVSSGPRKLGFLSFRFGRRYIGAILRSVAFLGNFGGSWTAPGPYIDSATTLLPPSTHLSPFAPHYKTRFDFSYFQDGKRREQLCLASKERDRGRGLHRLWLPKRV